jgi:two-component system response regulator AtoC
MITKLKIKVYSDNKDTSSVTSIIKELDISANKIICETPHHLKIKSDDMIILLLSNVNSDLLNNVLNLKDTSQNKFIVVTSNDSALFIASLVKLGFIDIFLFPYEIQKFISFLQKMIREKSYRSLYTEDQESGLYEFKTIIGTSEEFASVIEIAKRVTENSSVSVLLLGETGTGKSLLAKAIHKNSKIEKSGTQQSFPFIEIVCSAIPENLLESELFGYEKGAFTNANYRKLGLFELAENGTLFLDEVGDLSLNLQVKLLRVIEKKIIRRLGGIEDIPVNTRIISATNRDLGKMVENELFREDLYHRLNVVSIVLPPLRDRGEDVILLTEKFVEEFNGLYNKFVDTFEDQLKEFLLSYPWPGNVRELRNAVERAILLSDDNILRLNDFSILLKNLPLNALNKDEHIFHLPNLIRLDLSYEDTDLLRLNKLYAKEILRKMNGNKTKSARVLGISRPKLDKLLQ